MNALIDFLKMLLTLPVALSLSLLIAACGILLAAAFLIAFGVAGIHSHAGKSWHELLVATTRVRVSWIWGWSVACVLLLAYVSSLVYLERVASWLAALPYLITATLTILFAAWRPRISRIPRPRPAACDGRSRHTCRMARPSNRVRPMTFQTDAAHPSRS